MTALDASVVVCTRNRAAWLDQCLAALTAQTHPSARFEVIVVDNGSTDGSADVARRHAVRVEREPVVGLSRARNRGLACAGAPIVAFIDDDAQADPGWLAALLAAYEAHPSAVAVGGPIRLTWSTTRPRWLVADLEPWYSALGDGVSLYGANFSVRRETALAVGGFDTELGRVGTSLRSGEERDLLARLRAEGDVVHVADAGVAHAVLPERMTRRWVLRRAYAYGRYEDGAEPVRARTWLSALRRPSVARLVPCAVGVGVAVRRASARVGRGRAAPRSSA